MTLLSTLGFQPRKTKSMYAPNCTNSLDISIVLPVKDNQRGVALFLAEFLSTHTPDHYPKEIIIIETIEIAAGEDIDLGFRLREIGTLSYAPAACIFHNFDGGLFGFVRRFIRYGKGNKRISRLYAIDLTPRVFSPKEASLFNWLLSRIQYICLFWGYKTKGQ